MTDPQTMTQTTLLALAAVLLLGACDDAESKAAKLAIDSAETGAAGCHHILSDGAMNEPANPNEFQTKMLAAIRKGCAE